jgi:hypothetical protein
VPRGVDDDLLALEGGVEVGNDAYLPTRRVRLALPQRDREGLRRRPVLAALVEGAAVEVVLRLRLELAALDSRPLRALGRNDDGAARERVAPELRDQVSDP